MFWMGFCWGVGMGNRPRLRVMIQCPQTSRAIFTGRIASPLEIDAELAGKNAVGCSECGELHFWVVADAWLENSGEVHATASIVPERGG